MIAMKNEQQISQHRSGGCSGCLGFVIGGVVGAVASFILTPVYYDLTRTPGIIDAQWGMLFIITLPIGVMIGGILGCVIGVKIWSKSP